MTFLKLLFVSFFLLIIVSTVNGDPWVRDNSVYCVNGSNCTYNSLILNDLFVNNLTTINNYNVTGDSTFEGDINMSNHSIYGVWNLQVHNISGYSPVYISNEVIVNNNNVTADNFIGNFAGGGTFSNATIGNLTILGALTVIENAEVRDNLSVQDDAIILGDLILGGSLLWNESISELDPVFTSHLAYNINTTNTTAWDNDSDWCSGGVCTTLNVTNVIYTDVLNATTINVINMSANYIEVINLIADSINATNMTVDKLSASVFFADEMYVNGTFNGSVNWSLINNSPVNVSYFFNDAGYLTSASGNDTKWNVSDDYLTTSGNDLSFNETKLNETITAKTGIFEENISITVTSGEGTSATTSIGLDEAEILSLYVYPTSPTNTYRFEAYTLGSNDTVETDRIEHEGDWKIQHRGSTTLSEEINLSINSASIDESFIVNVRYRR